MGHIYNEITLEDYLIFARYYAGYFTGINESMHRTTLTELVVN